MSAYQEILKLKDGESWIWPESDYGKAEIWLKYNTYFLFEIPTFGEEPRFVNVYTIDTLQHLVKKVESWT